MVEIVWESIVGELRASDPEITESLEYLIDNANPSWGLANICPHADSLDAFWGMPGAVVLMCITKHGVSWKLIGQDGLLGQSLDPVTVKEAHVAIQGLIDDQVG